MASKSKKRRRVFRASCILAALIIAGSSFAWFTSSDEVTNRLSASADYGTKIVESFAPPKNWLPGQEVNKDVYATNTGTIGAFVREDISGTLTVTKEKATTELTDDSIELTEEERYAVEAGAYLAFKPSSDTTNKVGDQIVIRPDDKAGSSLTDFTPGAEGLYVFRRSIGVNADGTETFEYDGYYYVAEKPAVAADPGNNIEAQDAVPAKYYKVSGLSVVKDTVDDKAGDNVHTDGNLAAAAAGFWEEETKVVDPVSLTYVDYSTDNEANQNATAAAGIGLGKYLVAEYDTGNNLAQAKLIAAADAYDLAVHNYQYLTALAAAATDEAAAAGDTGALGTAAAALSGKQGELDAAKTALDNKYKALEDAQIEYNDAVTANKYDKQQAYASKTKLFGASATTEEDGTVTPNAYGTDTADGSLAKILKDANTAVSSATYDMTTTGKTAADALDAEILAWYNANKEVEGSEAKKILNDYTTTNGSAPNAAAALVEIKKSVAALEEFEKWIAGQTDNENHDYYAKVAAQTIAQLNYDNEMIKLYGAKNGGETASSSNTPTSGNYTDGSLWGKYQTAESTLTTKTSNLGSSSDSAAADGSAWAQYNKAVADLKTKQDEYNGAYKTWRDALKASNVAAAKEDEIDAAKDAAEIAMNKALEAYNEAKKVDEENKYLNKSDGTLKIYIKLNDNVNDDAADAWQMLPATVTNDTATFYYKSILEGGETSSKLIDSVTLDKRADQNMYKYFDFDLNVAMKSSQITYADDNKTILATSTPSELDAVANLETPTDINTKITWAKANT